MRRARLAALLALLATGAARAQFAPDAPPFTPADPTMGRPFDRVAPGPYGDPSLTRQGPLATPHPMFDDPARRVFASPPPRAPALQGPAVGEGFARSPGGRRIVAPPTITQTVEKQDAADPVALVRVPTDVGRRLAACWSPPASDQRVEATLRVAFAGDGRVIGAPRVTYVYVSQAALRQAARASALAAVAACAPLRLAPAAASAIAGRVFAIRLIAFPKGRQRNL